MKVKNLYTEGGEFYPRTHTGAVLTPDGRTAEQRNSEQMSDIEGKLSGKGGKASASEYPMLYLGSFNSLGEANAKLNQVYNTTDWKYQGRLRLSVNSQTLWVEQYALNVTQGMWMQVAYGPFAPSADGNALVAEHGKAHISFRMNNGHVNRPWTDFATEGLSLKTINGQSIIGSGDIHIEGGGGSVVVDPSLDPSSGNAIANRAVAQAVASLQSAIEALPSNIDGGVVMVKYWGLAPDNPSEGDYWWDAYRGTLSKYTNGAWVAQSLDSGVIYVSTVPKYMYRWSGREMEQLVYKLPDSALSGTSENAVQNKVVTNEIQSLKLRVQSVEHQDNVLAIDGLSWEEPVNVQPGGYDGEGGTLLYLPGEKAFYLVVGDETKLWYTAWSGNGSRKDSRLYDPHANIYHYTDRGHLQLLAWDAGLEQLAKVAGTDSFGGVTPLAAITSGVEPEQVGLAVLQPMCYYDYVYDTQLKTLLLRVRIAATIEKEYSPVYGETSGPRDILETRYYLTWSCNGRAQDYEEGKASDIDILPKTSYLTDPDWESKGLRGFFYLTDGSSLTIYHWDTTAHTLVPTGASDIDVQTQGNTLSINSHNVQFATVNGQAVLGGGNIAVGSGLIEPILWSGDYQEKDDWELGDYWFNTSDYILYRYIGHYDFEIVSKPCMLLHEDTTYTYTNPGDILQIAGENNVSGDSVANSICIAGESVQMKTVNGQSIVGNGNIVIEGGETEAIPTDNPLYPEYYLQDKTNIKYAPEYHKWPLVWYGGEIDGNVDNNIVNIAYNGTVSLPGECIYRDFASMNMQFCNWHVKYLVQRGIFALYVNGTYYTNWNNRSVYCNDQGVPYTNMVYACYRGFGKSESGGTTTYDNSVFKSVEKRPTTKCWNGSSWYNPYDGLTDFASAIKACVQANSGNLQLRPGKLYFFVGADDSPVQEINIQNKSDFVIDGHGGGVLVWKPISGPTGYGTGNDNSNALFNFNGCKNGIVRNFTVAGVRDNIAGGPSGVTSEMRLSMSDANMNFASIQNSNSNLLFENIETYGLHEDIHIKNSPDSYSNIINSNITYRNIKGVLTVGNVVRDVDNLLIDGYDMLQAGYANSGEHVIYFQGIPGDVRLMNCKIRASAPHVQMMFSHHPDGASNTTSVQNITFEGCEITGHRILGIPYGNQRIQFINCVIRVPYEQGGASNAPNYTYTEAMTTYGARWDFINCTIVSPITLLLHKSGSPTVNIDGCTFIRCPKKDGSISKTTKFFRDFTGQYILKNTKVLVDRTDEQQYLTPEVLPADAALELLGLDSGEDISTDKTLNNLQTAIYGLDTSELPSEEPAKPAIGDMYYDGENVMVCESGGALARIAFGNYKYSAESQLEGPKSIALAEDEVYEVIPAGQTVTLQADEEDGLVSTYLWKIIRDKFVNDYGFELVSSIDRSDASKRNPKTICRAKSGEYWYIQFTPSKVGAFAAYAYSRKNNENSWEIKNGTKANAKFYVLDVTTGSTTSREGSPSVWSVFQNGLKDVISDIEEDMTALESPTGSSGLMLAPTCASSAPANPSEGDWWLNTANNTLQRYTSSGWVRDTTGVMRMVYNSTNSQVSLTVGGGIVGYVTLTSPGITPPD